MTRRSLRFEQLERRLLLAGDVKAALTRGDLIVTGDNKTVDGIDETVEIAYLGASKYQLRGINGTTVNGIPPVDGVSSVDISGVTRDVIVDMKTGNDAVSLLTGPGDIRFRVARNLTVKGNTGNDTIVVQAADVLGILSLDGGLGDNVLQVQNTIVTKDASLKSLAGVDTVSLNQVTFRGKLTVDTGAGNDRVTMIGGSVAKDVSVLAGEGTNEVKFDLVTLNAKLTVLTGSGNDLVSVMDSTVVGNVSISTGAGADGVGLKSVIARSDVSVNAGTNPQFDGNEDRIGVAGGTARNMTLDGGDSGRNDKLPGQAEIGVTGIAIAGNLTIKTGHARDKVGLGSDPALIQQLATLLGVDLNGVSGRVSIGNVASISTGLGADLVGVRNASAKVFNLDTGDGNDQAFIGDVAPASPPGKMQVNIKMGNGDDLLVLTGGINLTDFSAASIDGGAGQDTLPNGKGWTSPVFKNWELFPDLI